MKKYAERAQGRISQQALSNYERGTSLPSEEMIPKLAEYYEIDPAIAESAYRSSIPQAMAGPVQEEPFLGAVASAYKGDHIVAITQRPLIAERPELATNMADLLSIGSSFTYVTYLTEKPTAETGKSHHGRWQSNHDYAAGILLMALRNNPEIDTDALSRINYLIIGNPDETDFAYLNPHGATIYLCRREESKHQESQLWSERRAPDGKHWWHPCDQGFMVELHDWLRHDCGLSLPGQNFKIEKVPQNDKRGIRLVTLEEFTS